MPVQAGQFASENDDLRGQLNIPTTRADEPDEGSRTQLAGATTGLDDVRTLSVEATSFVSLGMSRGENDVLRVSMVLPRPCD